MIMKYLDPKADLTFKKIFGNHPARCMKETEMVVNSVYDHWDVHEEKIKAIMGALTELTPRTQQIVQLCYVEHKKYREVAAELDISESAVKKHIMQALSYMRQKFKDAEFY